MKSWESHSIVVTGGNGFLGSAVVRKLREHGYNNIFIPRSREFDLRHEEAIRRLYEVAKRGLVSHLFALIGGINVKQAA